MLRAPQSRMDVLTETEIDAINAKSKLVRKYNESIDRESAYEMLNKKIEAAYEQAAQAEEVEQQETKNSEPSTASVVGKSVLKVVTSASFIRGAFSILSKMFKK
jgi:hypothetical protein